MGATVGVTVDGSGVGDGVNVLAMVVPAGKPAALATGSVNVIVLPSTAVIT